MQLKNKIILKVIVLLSCISLIRCQLLDTSGALLSRRKRYLIWHEGINWVQMIVGIGLPTELRDQAITLGVVAKAFYLLPTNSSDYTHPSIDYARKKRSVSRWIIYELIETFLKRYGFTDAKACMLKSICEAASVPLEKRSGVLAEVIHALLTPSSTKEVPESHVNAVYHAAEKMGKEVDNCEILFPECDSNIISQFSRFLK